MANYKPKTIHLDGKGLTKVLGEAEARIMELLWNNHPATVRQVRDELSRHKKRLSFNAVMTIMNRLVEKGLLTKEEKGKTFSYRPSRSREQFSRLVARDVLSSLLKDPVLFGAAAFSEFSESLDSNTRKLLEEFISSQKQ
ncbi:MAG: BlaI/MecI/CopY family transcriptional regulator [bacterium]|nr:BlaI/MecI/CopY family transcriptional regulator [bacterium]